MKNTMDFLKHILLFISLYISSTLSAHAVTLDLNGSFILYEQQKSGIIAYYDPINNIAESNHNLTGVMSINNGIGTAEFDSINIMGDNLSIHDVSFTIDPIGLIMATALIDYGTSLNTPIDFYWEIIDNGDETFTFYNGAIPCSGLCGWSPLGHIRSGPLESFGFDIVVTTTTVPVPPAIWLFGSGLLGLVGVARRKKA